MAEIIREWWAAIVAVVSVVIWLVRLEGRAAMNTRELAKLEQRLADQRREDLDARARDWDDLLKRLDVIRTEMRDDMKGVREDIRQLLATRSGQ